MLLWFKRAAFLIFIGFTGCGYTLNHRLKETFAYSNGIFVPVFTNSTEETGAEMIFTNAFIRELESHGEKTTNNKDESGIQIRGTLSAISYGVEAFTGTGYKGSHGAQYNGLQSYARIPDQIGVRVTIFLEVIDSQTKKVRWSKAFEEYRRVSAPLDRVSDQDAPSSVGLITQSIIESSYPEIARNIMRNIYDQMVDS
jgi:hypothetical protein